MNLGKIFKLCPRLEEVPQFYMEGGRLSSTWREVASVLRWRKVPQLMLDERRRVREKDLADSSFTPSSAVKRH